ncbi:hypothetical protein BJ875DRAFT_469147 [Amylocarpus encephaloides]|uniref:2EXR domain-containing protein n=1 Tax=Amylocarpus encephaloides TaxID=45428 RepID=A0A9P8C2Z4_9HELO|nr:hypothetical protein BJ875DRAFT_469147 [Amylocarpus encephaloides]
MVSISKKRAKKTERAKNLKTLASIEPNCAILETPAAKTPATEFHCFNKLPAELRIQIWEDTFPGPRLVPLITDNRSPCQIKIAAEYNTSYKAVANSCKEAWLLFHEGHKYSSLSLDMPRVLCNHHDQWQERPSNEQAGSYFDFQRDTALIDLRFIFNLFWDFGLESAYIKSLASIAIRLKDLRRVVLDMKAKDDYPIVQVMMTTLFSLIQLHCPNMEEVSRLYSAPGLVYKPGYDYYAFDAQHTPGRASSLLYQDDNAFKTIGTLGKLDDEDMDVIYDGWNNRLPHIRQLSGIDFQPLKKHYTFKFLVRKPKTFGTWQLLFNLLRETGEFHGHWEPIGVEDGEFQVAPPQFEKDMCGHLQCKWRCFVGNPAQG